MNNVGGQWSSDGGVPDEDDPASLNCREVLNETHYLKWGGFDGLPNPSVRKGGVLCRHGRACDYDVNLRGEDLRE